MRTVGSKLLKVKQTSGMNRIGVYSVSKSELEKPPRERLYQRIGLYDRSKPGWIGSSDGRLPLTLPDDRDHRYTIEDLQEAFETTTVHVYFENEVPGEVRYKPPTIEFDHISSSE